VQFSGPFHLARWFQTITGKNICFLTTRDTHKVAKNRFLYHSFMIHCFKHPGPAVFVKIKFVVKCSIRIFLSFYTKLSSLFVGLSVCLFFRS